MALRMSKRAGWLVFYQKNSYQQFLIGCELTEKLDKTVTELEALNIICAAGLNGSVQKPGVGFKTVWTLSYHTKNQLAMAKTSRKMCLVAFLLVQELSLIHI